MAKEALLKPEKSTAKLINQTETEKKLIVKKIGNIFFLKIKC